MNYLNKSFEELINLETNKKTIMDMKADVDSFMPSFSDSPQSLSRWGHHYFCDDDGGRLIFDLASPHEHKCEVCGKVYKGELFDNVWTYFYRNRAVVLALVSAVVYKAIKEKKYFDYAVNVIDFYAEHYTEFVLHNKENDICDSYENMKWGCGRMMPQGLNESIVAIRFVQTIEILRDELDSKWLNKIYHKMFREMFLLLAPQATRIHNISCWNLSAIGVMGLSFQDQEMIDFTFNSEYNIRRQLQTGVTADYFWYEGSIHYNFFILEGMSYLFLFSKIYDYDFGEKCSDILKNMFIKAYLYAFDNQYLPNPNDGWPNLNLKTFSYIYHTVARAFGENSEIGNITKLIENSKEKRTALPLSEPYYCNNQVCLEQLIFNIDFDYEKVEPVVRESYNYTMSNYAMLRNKNWNVFMKYGLNGKSHAHPDIMNIEVVYRNHRVSRDISNAGYRARLCNEWHRKTLAHNTVCWNGRDITSVEPGKSIEFSKDSITAKADDVYEGIDYTRTVRISENAIHDRFCVSGNKEGTYDYLFHFEADFSFEHTLEVETGDLEFKNNGYQHIVDTKKVVSNTKYVELYAVSGEFRFQIGIELKEEQELYLLRTMDNPVNRVRNSILIRSYKSNPEYEIVLKA